MLEKVRERIYKLKNRLYIEGQYLNDAGFEIRKSIRYEIDQVNNKITVVLSDETTGNRVAQTTVRSGKVVPVIDIKAKEVKVFFEKHNNVEVSIYKGKIIFTAKEEVSAKIFQFKKKACSLAIPVNVFAKAAGYEQLSLFDLFTLTSTENNSSDIGDIIKEKVSKTLNLLSLFSGIGAFEKSLSRQNISYNVVNYCEIDKHASKAYSLIHGVPESKNLWDVRNVGKKNVSKEIDAMTWGFPCFEAGTMVMTSDGYKNIENIAKGDYVLTHTKTFQKVIKPMKKLCNKIYEVQAYGVQKFKVTEEHPFYVRLMERKWDSNCKKEVRTFGQPSWVKAKALDKTCYIGIAINQNTNIPDWNGYIKRHRGNETKICELDFLNTNLWWLIGRYMGDGWTRVAKRKARPNSDNYRTVICCSKNDEEKKAIEDKLRGLFNYSVSEEKTTYRFHIVNKELTLFLMQFGNRAHNKHLTRDIFDLPANLLRCFIDGYISSDGCYTQNKYKISTVSRELAYGVQACIHKAYNRPCTLYQTKRKPVIAIEGRKIKQRTSWEIAFQKETRIQDKAFYEDGYIWIPFKAKVEKPYNDFVYNMSVENDESYTVYNLIVHNCTDLSTAGKKKGFIDVDGNVTRSGLYFEGIRILKELKPKFSIIENVKALISKKFSKEFNMILSDLKEAGYSSFWTCYNASDFDVAQNRERVFIVSIREDIVDNSFELISHKSEKMVQLKDFLETEDIDEKYFVSEVTRSKFKEKISINKKTNIISLGQVSNDGSQAGKVYSPLGNFPTVCACTHGYAMGYIKVGNAIRKLLPIECGRLMGFDDDDVIKCLKAKISDTQIYKMMGNSIVVNILEHISSLLFKEYKEGAYVFS